MQIKYILIFKKSCLLDLLTLDVVRHVVLRGNQEISEGFQQNLLGLSWRNCFFLAHISRF